MVYRYAIIGFGPAGIFTLASLPAATHANTLILEASCVGGDLLSKWCDVIANVTQGDMLRALRSIPRWESVEMPYLAGFAADACPPLIAAAKQLVSLARNDMRNAEYHQARVASLQRTAAGHWTITTTHGTMYEAQNVILCTGAIQKCMDLPCMQIPLEIALSRSRLAAQIEPEHRVVVFGTAHSGTLALQNLKDCGVRHVTAIHRSVAPFVYARDGYTEGIKQESARIADEILSGAWGVHTPTLLRYENFAAVYRALHEADRVIYAIGFETPQHVVLDAAGNRLALNHNPATGQFIDIDGLWGFGLAHPSTYVGNAGNVYPDVGFSGFIQAIQRALPALTAA
jgi:pyruvate/2-oxoglutarate dehydrogenase complex dihydrolipoamide dehydrogenase (E3) component